MLASTALIFSCSSAALPKSLATTYTSSSASCSASCFFNALILGFVECAQTEGLEASKTSISFSACNFKLSISAWSFAAKSCCPAAVYSMCVAVCSSISLWNATNFGWDAYSHELCSACTFFCNSAFAAPILSCSSFAESCSPAFVCCRCRASSWFSCSACAACITSTCFFTPLLTTLLVTGLIVLPPTPADCKLPFSFTSAALSAALTPFTVTYGRMVFVTNLVPSLRVVVVVELWWPRATLGGCLRMEISFWSWMICCDCAASSFFVCCSWCDCARPIMWACSKSFNAEINSHLRMSASVLKVKQSVHAWMAMGRIFSEWLGKWV